MKKAILRERLLEEEDDDKKKILDDEEEDKILSDEHFEEEDVINYESVWYSDLEKMLQEAGFWMSNEDQQKVYYRSKIRICPISEVLGSMVRQTEKAIKFYRTSPEESRWYRVGLSGKKLEERERAWQMFLSALSGLDVVVPNEICYVVSSFTFVFLLRVDGPNMMKVTEQFSGMGRRTEKCPCEIRQLSDLGHYVNIFLSYFRCFLNGNHIGQSSGVKQLLRNKEDKANVMSMVLEVDEMFAKEYRARLARWKGMDQNKSSEKEFEEAPCAKRMKIVSLTE